MSFFCILQYAVVNLDEEAENFLLFETQVCKPDIMQSVKVEGAPGMLPVKNISTVGNSQKGLKTPSGNKVPVLVVDDAVDDADDFMDPVIKTRSGKRLVPRKKDPAVSSRNITSTKRPTRRPRKLWFRVPALKPGKFTDLDSAHLLKSYILCDHAQEKYKE